MPAKRSREETVRPRSSPVHPPRLRDLPAPRRTESVIGPLFRWAFAWPYRMALAGLNRTRLRPWHVTILSLVTNVVTGWLLITGRRFLPGMLLPLAGLLDIFDGGLARLRGEASRAGAFLDSVVDRISDLVIFGCLFWAEASQGHRLSAALALGNLIVSPMVSQVRAEAEALGLNLTEGLVQRLERYVALMFGLLVPATLSYVLGLLAGLGLLTVLQRSASAWVQLTGLDRGQVPPAGSDHEAKKE